MAMHETNIPKYVGRIEDAKQAPSIYQGQNLAQADRPMTEMESVSANLGDLVRRLSIANDNMAARLDRFISTPTTLGKGERDPEPTEPPPGTIGSIKHLLSRLETEVNRARAFEGNLSGVI